MQLLRGLRGEPTSRPKPRARPGIAQPPGGGGSLHAAGGSKRDLALEGWRISAGGSDRRRGVTRVSEIEGRTASPQSDYSLAARERTSSRDGGATGIIVAGRA